MRPQGSQKRGGVVAESVPRGQPSLARAKTHERKPGSGHQRKTSWDLVTNSRAFQRSTSAMTKEATIRVVKPKFGAGLVRRRWVVAQSRCQCREVSHSCGVRLEFPKKGCPLQGRQRNQLPARCAAVRPTGDVLVPAPGRSTKSSKWCRAIPGWCTLALLGMCTGKGPAGKVATGWRGDKRNHVVGFRFKFPGVAQDGHVWLQGHMPLRAVRG